MSCLCFDQSFILPLLQEVHQHSASALSSRAKRPNIYSREIEDSDLRLVQILRQDFLTEESFSDLKVNLDRLEGQPLPLDRGSACNIPKLDFWHDRDEYEEAYSHREAMQEHYRSFQSRYFLEAIVARDHQDKKVDKIQDKLSTLDAEIARL